MIKENDIPFVSLRSMNEVHFEEVLIINTLFEQLENKVSLEILSQSLEKLLEHMQQHFSSEEKFMHETQYPSINMHKAEHGKVLNEARYIGLQWRNKKDENIIREYLKSDLVPWLDQHIKAMDMPMADYVKQMIGE